MEYGNVESAQGASLLTSSPLTSPKDYTDTTTSQDQVNKCLLPLMTSKSKAISHRHLNHQVRVFEQLHPPILKEEEGRILIVHRFANVTIIYNQIKGIMFHPLFGL